jgi:hypothetical protein
MPQGKAAIFQGGAMHSVKKLLQIVDRSEAPEVVERQLLCGKTSQLMARVLDGMLMTIQVPTRPHPRICCFSV